jgi:copper chaperone NosL
MRNYLVMAILLLAVAAGGIAVAGGHEPPACDCCAKGKQTVATAPTAKAPESDTSCKYCGMDREKFAHSRMLIEYNDGTTAAVCSLRCAAVELINTIDRIPRAIRVGDYATRRLIDAEQAVWVIGGSRPGVMTGNPKWAFAGRDAAEAFIRENGGRLATFDEAMAAACGDLYQDAKIIRERRKMRMKQ